MAAPLVVKPGSTDRPPPEPWRADWAPSGLEAVAACPLCGDPARTVWHEGLVDNSFRVAPGRWTLWRCSACTAGYLSPRPTPQTIGAAYESYYTHAAVAQPALAGGLAWLRRLRHRWSAGYANHRYGSSREPAAGWGGRLAAALLPMVGTIPDRELRHLPRPMQPPGAVLDVGCGDGAFLEAARGCGWQVLGLEPDPKAAALATSRGVAVLVGGLEALRSRAEAFDVITLSHVIEHVHDPLQALRDCHRLLKPGGHLWIETPNADSRGHAVFGRNWRGLEAPRHLVLFNPASLRAALLATEFVAPRTLASPSPRRWMFERSAALALGRWPDDPVRLTPRQRLGVVLGNLLDRLDDRRCEFITVGARKPG